jgi:hypothetical protein
MADAKGYAGRPITKVPDWHGLVVWDLLLNNLATGVFLVAALGELAAPRAFMPVANVAYPIALVLLLAELAVLTIDLGDPRRFHHMLRVFKPSSPMSFGVWSLSVYSFPLAVLVATELFGAEHGAAFWVRKVAIVVALVPAFASAAYKGVLLSTTAQPGWRDARWLGGYLASAAFLLGAASLLALAVATGQPDAAGVLHWAALALAVVNLVPLLLLAAELRPTLESLVGRVGFWRTVAHFLGGAVVVPLCLLVGGNEASVVAGVLLLFLGSLAIRYVVVKLPEAVHGRHP